LLFILKIIFIKKNYLELKIYINLTKMQNLELYENFDDMGLNDKLLRGIYGYGYEKPSSIQQKAIVPISSDNDIIVQAQSGTGKSATFIIGTLQKLNKDLKSSQTIILSPTRELATQTENVFKNISKYLNITSSITIGGTNISENINELKNGSQYIIGTPGRVFDMLKRGYLDSKNLKNIVIDEADEMLSQGFKEQIYEIFQYLPQKTQVILVSATMPNEVLELTTKFMKEPLKILVKSEDLTLEGIVQFYIDVVQEQWKIEVICDLYNQLTVTQCVIFCNTIKKVEWVTKTLTDKDFVVSEIHGEMSQQERNKIMNNFRTGAARVLVTTDLLARGIDVQQVSLVINYDLPKSKENYIHRIGRSGRFGRKGVAINLVTNNDKENLQELEKFYSTVISEMPTDINTYLV
jgi:translation initiation factor 4A